MHLDGQDWRVDRAEPMTAAEFGRTERLALHLRRIQIAQVDPSQILYSLPTIENTLAPLAEGSSKLGRAVLEIHEDDWRQFELVARGLEEAVRAELGDIRRILDHCRSGMGFRECHLRSLIPEPLAGTTITLEDVRAAVGGETRWLDGLAYQGAAGVVSGSFALQTPAGMSLYGSLAEGRLTTLCLHDGPAEEMGWAPLLRLAGAHKLWLVDWRRAAQFDAEPAGH